MKKGTAPTATALSLATLLTAAGTTANAAEEWEFSLAPLFLWGVSIEGESTVNGTQAPLDLDFNDDVLENLEGVITLHFEARRGDWAFFAEHQYLDLKFDLEGSRGPVTANVDIDFDTTMWEFGAAWTFSEEASTRWELLFGARHTDHELTVDLDISTPFPELGGQASIDGGDDWVHGFGGVRVTQALSDNWSFLGRADYGYGGSDDSAINLAAIFDYRFRDWGSAFAGYKYMEYDYATTSYAYDAKQQGPLLGLNFYW